MNGPNKQHLIKRVVYSLSMSNDEFTIKDVLIHCPSPEINKITKPYIGQVLSQLVESKYLTRVRRSIYTRGLGDDPDLHKWERSIMPKVLNQDVNDADMKFSWLGVDTLRDRLIRRNYNNSIYASCSEERLMNLYNKSNHSDLSMKLIQIGYKLHDESIVKGVDALRWFAFAQVF